jgi:hypothetical protein
VYCKGTSDDGKVLKGRDVDVLKGRDVDVLKGRGFS